MSVPELFAVLASGDVHRVEVELSRLELDRKLPRGTYTAFRTYEGHRVLCLDRHLARMEHAVRAMELDDSFSADLLRAALSQIFRDRAPGDCVVRTDVFEAVPDQFGVESRTWIGISPLPPSSPDWTELGVGLDFLEGLSRARPELKDTSWILRRQPHPVRTREKNDALLLDAEGRILEGTSCNFYAVRDGRLLTADSGVLSGVVRSVVLELAAELGIDVVFECVHRDELDTLSEALISSSVRGILPVTRIGPQVLADGRPGPVARRLLEALAARIESSAERL